MADIDIEFVDFSNVKIHAERSIREELKDVFSFFVPNYKFHPKFKAGYWDGRISLINWKDGSMLYGLVPEIVEFCNNRELTYDIDPQILNALSDYQITDDKAIEFYERIGGPFELHDSQLNAFTHCVNNGRSIILAPTSNGKSYIIHGLAAFYAMQKKRVLIIIDRSQLVEQLRENLRDEYGGTLRYVTIYDKIAPSHSNVFITTWQSIYENDDPWFKQFDVIIGDEVHKFKADSLKKLLSKCGHINIRHGFTGTLDNDSKTDRLTLIGMFGSPIRVATTRELIEAGIIARPTIYAIVRKYTNDQKKQIVKTHGTTLTDSKGRTKYIFDFPDEYQYLESNDERNDFIAKLESRLNGNTLIAFKREIHGKNIVNSIKQINNDKEIFYVSGKVAVDKRLEYSKQIDTMVDATAVVSTGTFSTGVSIKNINNLIIACQIKSKITVPQLIGRSLRITLTKKTSDVYDIGDDISINGKPNATYTHFLERLEMYASEGFEIKLIEYQVKMV